MIKTTNAMQVFISPNMYTGIRGNSSLCTRLCFSWKIPSEHEVFFGWGKKQLYLVYAPDIVKIDYLLAIWAQERRRVYGTGCVPVYRQWQPQHFLVKPWCWISSSSIVWSRLIYFQKLILWSNILIISLAYTLPKYVTSRSNLGNGVV